MRARCGWLVALCCVWLGSTAFAQEPAPPSPPPATTVPPGESTPSSTGVPPVPTGNPAERQAWLRTRLDEQLAAPPLRSARVGVAVMDVESGRVLYARGEKLPYNPASNAKIVTTAAALALLGPEYRFKTALYADELHGSEVAGNLYVRGFGDPSFVTEDLWKLVSDLYALGVRKISGDIVIDDSFFDPSRLPPAYDQKQDDAAWHAPTGATSLNYNAISVTIAPGAREGELARVSVEPQSAYIAIENRVRLRERFHQLLAVRRRQRREHLAGRTTRSFVEHREGTPAFGRQRQAHMPCVVLGALARHQLQAPEALQQAAEVSKVQVELGAERARRAFTALAELVEHARLRQRERAAEVVRLQRADAAGIEAVEPAHAVDAGHGP